MNANDAQRIWLHQIQGRVNEGGGTDFGDCVRPCNRGDGCTRRDDRTTVAGGHTCSTEAIRGIREKDDGEL